MHQDASGKYAVIGVFLAAGGRGKAAEKLAPLEKMTENKQAPNCTAPADAGYLCPSNKRPALAI